MNKISKDELNKVKKLEECIYFNIKNHYKNGSNIVIVCIGTDRCTGDALGPIIGTKLKKRKSLRDEIIIYGTLENPVDNNNLDEILKKIDKNNNIIIVIEAALGNKTNIGDIIVETGCLFPGIKVNKKLLSQGDINIKGIIEEVDNIFYPETLYKIRLFFINEMAKTIELALNNSLKRIINTKDVQ